MIKTNLPKEDIKLWDESFIKKYIFQVLDYADLFDLTFIFLYLKNLYDINGKGEKGNCNLMLDYQIIFGDDDEVN